MCNAFCRVCYSVAMFVGWLMWTLNAYQATVCIVHDIIYAGQRIIATYRYNEHRYFSKMDIYTVLEEREKFTCYVSILNPRSVSQLYPVAQYLFWFICVAFGSCVLLQCYYIRETPCKLTRRCIDRTRAFRHRNTPDCVICEERPQSCRYDCGHSIACYRCSVKLRECPICRARINKITTGFYDEIEYIKP